MYKDKPVPIPTEFIENPDNLDPYIIYRKARELGIFYHELLEAQLEYLYPSKYKKLLSIYVEPLDDNEDFNS
tara:strand:+ start:606 stop:821 length:216 start_codon:yes stop_codon:yes gene_type:complete